MHILFLDGEHVDLCVEANVEKGYVRIYDIDKKQVNPLFGNVEILRWDLVHSKE